MTPTLLFDYVFYATLGFATAVGVIITVGLLAVFIVKLLEKLFE